MSFFTKYENVGQLIMGFTDNGVIFHISCIFSMSKNNKRKVKFYHENNTSITHIFRGVKPEQHPIYHTYVVPFLETIGVFQSSDMEKIKSILVEISDKFNELDRPNHYKLLDEVKKKFYSGEKCLIKKDNVVFLGKQPSLNEDPDKT